MEDDTIVLCQNEGMSWAEFLAALKQAGEYHIYDTSCNVSGKTYCAIVRNTSEKKLAVMGDNGDFVGIETGSMKICPLTVENANALMKYFPYTKPCSHQGHPFTFGLGDRLGLATPGQLRAISDYGAFPVLAQQSIRELNLTGRTFPEVIAAAAFGVFQEGYQDGYGADGDHLKTREEIKYALDSGCTMITLDCSEYINDDAATFDGTALNRSYAELPETTRSHYEKKYLNKKLPMIGELSSEGLKRIVLVFYKAVEHAISCYQYIAETATDQVDFELSIDEAMAITAPSEHYIIAAELHDAGITPVSVAPHFIGYFEKGIEYQGNLDQFASDLKVHQQIADAFGYKLSLHSGSDKFSVFSILHKITKGNVHVKTAGTNWLEAVRVLAREEPKLYRKAHQYALEHRSEATKYYHVTTDPKTIPNIDLLSDAYLPELLELPASRQLMHITYGILLSQPWFRVPFFAMLHEKEEAYYSCLERHIGRHLRYLTAD
ncbi:MAG: tagaturonate epimerase family protein [Oscillospiraceae bacterium]|nr:tagaturonate epimerase family protein [Oscillospiraceae bacterium]